MFVVKRLRPTLPGELPILPEGIQLIELSHINAILSEVSLDEFNSKHEKALTSGMVSVGIDKLLRRNKKTRIK